MILIFPLPVLKRRFTLLQSKIINADGGSPGFSSELIDCRNSMECIAVEIYFASAGDTQKKKKPKKKKLEKWSFFYQNHGLTLFGKMAIFRLFELLVFIAWKGVFSF